MKEHEPEPQSVNFAITLEAEQLNQLRRLANAASGPGAAVSPNDS